jgi:CBS domain-containing protein
LFTSVPGDLDGRALTEGARMMTECDVDRLVVVGADLETALGVISDSDLVRAISR